MKIDIKSGRSPISHRDGIAVEVGEHTKDASPAATKQILWNLKAEPQTASSMLYEEQGTFAPGEIRRNFEIDNGGSVAFLSGEKAHQHGGIRAIVRGTE